jgi:hypothetical protein
MSASSVYRRRAFVLQGGWMLDAIPLWAWLVAPWPSVALIAYVIIGRRIADGRGIVREVRCKEVKVAKKRQRYQPIATRRTA